MKYSITTQMCFLIYIKVNNGYNLKKDYLFFSVCFQMSVDVASATTEMNLHKTYLLIY